MTEKRNRNNRKSNPAHRNNDAATPTSDDAQATDSAIETTPNAVDNKEVTEPSPSTDDAATKDDTQPKAKVETPTASIADTPPPAAKAPAAKSSKTGWVAIALVIALTGGLYYHGHQQSTQSDDQLLALQSQLNELKEQLGSAETRLSETINKQLDATSNTLEGQAAQLSQTAAKTESQLAEQAQSVASLQKALAEVEGRRPNDWLLAEADYLLRMASRKLMLEKDLNSALLLLSAGSARLAEMNDPTLTPIRQAIADDINTLRNTTAIDVDGLVIKINSLQGQIDTMPLAQSIQPERIKGETQPLSGDVKDWKANLKTSLTNFRDQFVTYRQTDGDIAPLLAPEQEFFVRENIKLKLETAMKAAYREQQEIYNQSLVMAKAWAEQFFFADSTQTQNFLEQLDALKDENVVNNYPTSLKAQPMVSDLINEKLRLSISQSDVSKGE